MADGSARAFKRFRDALLSDLGLSLVADERPADPPPKLIRMGEAGVSLSQEKGLLIVAFIGPITARELATGQAQGEDDPVWTARAVLVDWRAARLQFSANDLRDVLEGSKIAQSGRPRAFVVDSEQASKIKDAALRTAHLGVLQRGFADRRAAMAWALSREAQLR